MIRSNGFQFLNESREHILDGEIFNGALSLSVYAGDEREDFIVSHQEVLELAQALVNLVENARANQD